jgi:hypothetical protein
MGENAVQKPRKGNRGRLPRSPLISQHFLNEIRQLNRGNEKARKRRRFLGVFGKHIKRLQNRGSEETPSIIGIYVS